MKDNSTTLGVRNQFWARLLCPPLLGNFRDKFENDTAELDSRLVGGGDGGGSLCGVFVAGESSFRPRPSRRRRHPIAFQRPKGDRDHWEGLFLDYSEIRLEGQVSVVLPLKNII